MASIGPGAVRAAVHAAERFGSYFALHTEPAGSLGWRPVVDLYADTDGCLDDLIDATGRRLGTGDRRAAGSILHLGYAARLWSLTLGPVLVGGVLPDLPADTLEWRSTAQNLVEFALAEPRGRPVQTPSVPAEDAAEEICRVVVDTHLVPMAGRLRRTVSLSAEILLGNTVSALVGTLRLLATDPTVPTRPLARALLDRGDLGGAGTVHLDALPATFVRRTCCLYYRVPGGDLCGDCVLRHRHR